MDADLCGLVISISFDELLSGAAIGVVGSVSVGQGRGGREREGARGRGRRGGGGGLGVQAVEGVSPWGQHHSHLGQKPAPKLILVKQIKKQVKDPKEKHKPYLHLTLESDVSCAVLI